jgi:hypothetical protein
MVTSKQTRTEYQDHLSRILIMTKPIDHPTSTWIRSVSLVTATETEPRRFGKQVVLGGVLDHLMVRLGPENVHVILVGVPDAERPPVPYRRHVVAKPGGIGQATSVLGRTVLPAMLRRQSRSLQESVLFSPRVQRQISDALVTIGSDLEIWDTIRMGQFVPGASRSGARRVLYADDLFSERYAAMLREPDHGDAGGQFAALLPGPARRLLASPRVQRGLLRAEQQLVARSEERQPPWFERTLLVSEEETALLRTRLHPGPTARTVSCLPPRLKPQVLTPHAVSTDGRPEFTFIGGFGYAPNRLGLDWFLRACREPVLAQLPDLRINVVGPGTEVGLESAAAWGRAVRFLGWVDDLDEVLARSVALLSPLRSGSGIKIKVLEALSRGLPVVATPAGVQGIARPDRPGATGFMVGEEPDELARAMVAMCDPDTRAAAARAARRTWDQTYDPSVVEPVYDEAFGLRAA